MKRDLRAFNAFMLHESGLSYRRIREKLGLARPERARALVARGQRMHLSPAPSPALKNVELTKLRPKKRSVRESRYEKMIKAALEKFALKDGMKFR